MLFPKLTNSPQCAEIPALLENIDCALAKLSIELYNNTIYMFNKRVDSYSIFALLEYKKILTIKYCEPDYLSCFTIPMIASKVKKLSLNCKSKCVEQIILTTTTTTTVAPTTTTTTTVVPTTTTTTTSNCISWIYNVSLYLCEDCSATGGGSMNNFEPLTIGKWYNYNGFKMQVNSLITCSAGDPVETILDSSGTNTCGELVCPPTTTTTTTII